MSYDTVLAQLFPSSASISKVDLDKAMWNNFDVCSTVQETEQLFDSQGHDKLPVLFYSQAMNVHQFAKNALPLPMQDGWRHRPGFNNRIAHEVHQVDTCLGEFFEYLSRRGLYENSIIVLTSDHGDATGELGRTGHSVLIYPEIMRVPLIIHLPSKVRENVVYDNSRITTLTDITPSLYYLLGHKPILHNPLFGRPIFANTRKELDSYMRGDLFLASDVRAVYGILADQGRWFYVTYDSPADSMLFDLVHDPTAQHNVLTSETKKKYDEEIIERMQAIAKFYDYQPNVGSWLSAQK